MNKESRWSPRDAASYDAQWKRLAASGQSPHGEVDFVQQFQPQRVLDAGCGTGRVAIELDARGVDVHGVDLDASMIAAARRKAPHLAWTRSDLAFLDLRSDANQQQQFDLAVMAGNVMIFVAPGTEPRVVERITAHVRPGGLVVAGFQLDRSFSAWDYSDCATAAGLEKVGRWSTWSAEPFTSAATYGVFAHRRPVTQP